MRLDREMMHAWRAAITPSGCVMGCAIGEHALGIRVPGLCRWSGGGDWFWPLGGQRRQPCRVERFRARSVRPPRPSSDLAIMASTGDQIIVARLQQRGMHALAREFQRGTVVLIRDDDDFDERSIGKNATRVDLWQGPDLLSPPKTRAGDGSDAAK
eukprot:8202117-Pyramimonas_sp.AAC.1